jgi:DNA helicase-2/ATP-dependent DNA helicase PcrA
MLSDRPRTLDLSRLSAQQRRVVLAGDGPLVVIAGPGSGKTAVLAARVAYLVAARAVAPASILALTFTAAAARELRARLLHVLGEPGEQVDVQTFHALGLRICRHWSEALGLGSDAVVVYGGADARALLRVAADEASVDLARWPLPLLGALLERYRLCRAREPRGAPRDPSSADAGGRGCATPGDVVEAVAEGYEALLLRRRAVDFPAMLALPLQLFARRPDALRLYQDAYRHVLCDEVQDACPTQLALVRQLTARHRNLTAVGDPCQNLYRFRGADVRFLLECRREYPDATVVELDENFRSSGRIVALANALGAGLPYRRPMRTARPAGPHVVLHAAPDEAAEAAFVAEEIERLAGDGRISGPGDVAVLFRTNRQADELALAFRARRLPYDVRGGADFFARREVRDALAYLRLAHCPADGAALARLVKVPPRRLARLARRLRAHPAGTEELVARAGADGPAAAAAAAGLVGVVAELHAASTRLAPADLLDLALERTGYRAWLEGQPDGASRRARLDTLRVLASRATGTLADWLAEVHTDEDDALPPSGERTLLTTVHRSKGGEWPVVFVVGAEEGLLPHRRALLEEPDPRAALEDELRVAYVAVTRARQRLYLSHCRGRRAGGANGAVAARRPSRFLLGLLPGLVVPDARGTRAGPSTGRGTGGAGARTPPP